MKPLFLNHQTLTLSHRTARFLCLAFTSSLLLAGVPTQAQLGPPITNYFTGNTDQFSGVDSYPGGDQGWSTPWGTSGAISPSVQNSNPLSTNANYLQCVIANTSSRTTVYRPYVDFAVSTDPTDYPNPDSFNINFNPHKISFDFRVDSFTTGSDTNWSDEGSSSDTAFISGENSGGSKPTSSSSWLIQVFGTSPSISNPTGPANTFLYIDGSTLTNNGGTCQFYNSGMAFNFNTVYHFDIINDPRDKVYQVTVNNGVTTNVSPWLHHYGYSDPTEFGTGDTFVAGAGVSLSTDTLTFSLGGIIIQQLPPSQYPPRITELAPYYWMPTPSNIASHLSFVPQLNPPVFYPASKGLSFVASTGGGGSNDMVYLSATNTIDQSTNPLAYNLQVAHTTIPTSGVGLVLNGANVSSGLTFFGAPNYLHVNYPGLAPNTVYTGTIYVTNSAGGWTSRNIAFDTFDANSAVVIEAEDYNFGNGGYTRPGDTGTDSTVGGMFIQNPIPSDFLNGAYLNQGLGYVDKDGATNIDYFCPNVLPDQFSASLNQYRIADAISTTPANDYVRTKYLNSGARDFQVNNLQTGEWMNYTRNFAPGYYTPYLRAASTFTSHSGVTTVNFDLVQGDPTSTNQTLTNLGLFNVTYTGNDGTFTNVPMTSTNGPTIYLSGTNTVRLTANNANNNIWLNYLVLAPASSTISSVAITSPSPGASFAAGTNITLTASASASDGISSVQYFNGSTSIGSSASPPYTVTWSSVPTGKYSIYAVATSGGGFTADSTPVEITVGSPGKNVLFVIDSTTEANGVLNAGDAMITNIIAGKGWNTYLYSNAIAETIGPEAANGFDLVVITANSSSSLINMLFRDVPVPVWNYNQAEQGGRMGVTKEISGVDYGIQGAQNTVTVVATNDPAAAGYSGIQSLFQNPDNVAYGYPNANAIIITKNTNDPALYASTYYYQAGAEMCEGVVAPAVRYQFFDANPTTMATNISVFGSNILSAGLSQAAANPQFAALAPEIIKLISSSGNITLPFTGLATDSASLYSVYGSPTAIGPYSLINSAVITGPVGTTFQATVAAPTNSQYYYRIVRQ